MVIPRLPALTAWLAVASLGMLLTAEVEMKATSESQDPVPAAAVPSPSGPAQPSSPQPGTPAGAEQPDKRWEWLTFLALAVLVYHLLALWYRWLRPDPDFLAFSTGVAELLAIASLLGLQTERGRKLVFSLDDLLGLGRVLNSRRRICLAACLVAFVSVVLLYVGSPVAANRLRHQGLDALEDGGYSTAIAKFRRAASLVPHHAPTHYNLAAAYEAVHNYERAIAEYQAALELDDEFWPVYNNLGRLHLRALGDPDAALSTLQAGQRRATDPLGASVIGSNVAWAYIEKALPRSALAELEQVTGDLDGLRRQGQSVEIYLARAYQLEALAHQALASPSEARRAWQDCLGYALAVAESASCSAGGPSLPPDCLDAFRYVAEAREELAKGTGGL